MESELVSGFMTEHAAVVFVFFFLAEYGSIVLMCILTSILFLGGYLLIDLSYFFKLVHYILYEYLFIDWVFQWKILLENSSNNPTIEGLLYGFSLGLKSSIMIFIFIWVFTPTTVSPANLLFYSLYPLYIEATKLVGHDGWLVKKATNLPAIVLKAHPLLSSHGGALKNMHCKWLRSTGASQGQKFWKSTLTIKSSNSLISIRAPAV